MNIKNIDFLFNENPNPMWIYDPSDLSIKGANKSALELYGYREKEIESMTICDLCTESEVPKMEVHLSKPVKEFNNAGIWKHQKKNGDTLFVRVLTCPITHEGKSYKVVSVQDVTNEIKYRQEHEMLLKNSLDGIMLTNPNGEVYEANEAACTILEMTEEEIIQLGREGLVCKDQKLEKALEIRARTGQFSGELTLAHKSGRKIPVELTSSVFTNFQGEERTSMVFRDISDRKKAEKALEHEKEFTDVVLNSLPGIFFVLNEQGEVIRWNHNSNRVFGLTDQEIDGRPAADFVHEDDQELVFEEIERVFNEGQTTIELRLKTGDNRIATYKFVANCFHQDDRVYIVGSGIDMSQQKELEKTITSLLEQELKERKEAELDRDKLRRIYEKTPSPKCFLEGEEYRYSIANKAYRKLIGQEDIIGKKLIDVIPELAEQGFIDILNQVYKTGETFIGYEVPAQINKSCKEAKQEYILNLILQPVLGEKGRVEGIFAEAVDITDQFAYQQQLEDSLKEKETLLGEIHHRVKNNLAVICSMLELQSMDSSNLELRNLLTASQQRIRSIALIHELLYQSKDLSQVNFEENIKRLMESLATIYDGQGRIEVAIQSDPISLNINQAIPCALIINEVATNAFKHAFQEKDNGKITISLVEQLGNVQIQIRDNGAGLPENFNQGKSNSLGLTLVKSLCQQLEADLKFSNQKGAKFSLSFEMAEIKGSASTLVA